MCVCVCVCVCVCKERGCSLVTACLPGLGGSVSLEPSSSPAVGTLQGTNSSGQSTPSCRVTGLRQWEALIEGRRQRQGRGVSPHLYTGSRALSSGCLLCGSGITRHHPPVTGIQSPYHPPPGGGAAASCCCLSPGHLTVFCLASQPSRSLCDQVLALIHLL